jgi:hypothetical protein
MIWDFCIVCIKTFWLIVNIEVAIVARKDLGIFCASDYFLHTPPLRFGILDVESLN